MCKKKKNLMPRQIYVAIMSTKNVNTYQQYAKKTANFLLELLNVHSKIKFHDIKQMGCVSINSVWLACRSIYTPTIQSQYFSVTLSNVVVKR